MQRTAGSPAREIVEPFARLGVVFQRGIEMAPIALGDETRQQRTQGGANLADQTKLDPSPTTDRLCPDVDLGDAGILREELPIGEIRASIKSASQASMAWYPEAKPIRPVIPTS